MKNRTSKRSLKALCALGASVALGGACGGRAVTIEGGSENGVGAYGAGASGGAVAAGGSGAASGRATGGTGNVGRGGSSSAGSASAGAASAGGEGGCAHTSCPPIACTGAVVYAPGACCPTCESNCLDQPCPGIACASGYQLQTQPGQCCPTCVPSTMVDCATGEKNYAALKAALLSKYTYGCATDTDCVVSAPTNSCEPGGCGWVPVWKGAVESLNSNLANEAALDCVACGAVPVPPCAPPLPTRCVNQQCQVTMPGAG